MRSFRILFVCLLLVASVASATVLQTFDSRASWEAATTGKVNVDLESLGLGVSGYASYSNVSGLTTGGLHFVGVLDVNQYFLYALNPPSGADENFGTSTILKGPEYRATSYLSITMPAATTSFGLDLMTAFPSAQSFRVLVDGVDTGVVVTTQNRPNPTFFGFTTDTSITEVRILLNGGTLNNTMGLFDNFAYGTASTGGTTGGGTGGTGGQPTEETPEIATMVALGSGLMMLRWMHRRRPVANAAF